MPAPRVSRAGRVAAALLFSAWAVQCAVQDRSNAFIGYSEKSHDSTPSKAGCVDEAENCVSWASNGECKKNAGFMNLKCKKSCDACNLVPEKPTLPPLPASFPRDIVEFSTAEGNIQILLRPDLAPKTAAYVKSVAAAGACDACRFYRAEAVAEPGAIDNFGGPGPPYALLQGSLSTPSFQAIDKEEAPLVGRGFACLIGSGPDFFLAVGPHSEWGNGHTVWGEVQTASLPIIDKFVNELPVKKETWGETHVTTLVTPVPFKPKLLSSSR